MVSKIVFTIAIFLFIKEKEDYILQPLFTSLGFVVSGGLAMYLILHKWNYEIFKPDFREILMTIKSSTDVFLSNIVPNLYSSLSTILLGVFHGSVANGIFDAGNKFIHITQNFINIIARVFFPYLSRDIRKHDLYARLSMLLAVIVSVALYVFAPTIIHVFFTEEFESAITVLRICSFMIIISMIDSVYGINFMLIQGYERERRKIVVVISVIGAFVAAFLVYKFSFIGKAYSLILINGILSIVTFVFCKIKKK